MKKWIYVHRLNFINSNSTKWEVKVCIYWWTKKIRNVKFSRFPTKAIKVKIVIWFPFLFFKVPPKIDTKSLDVEPRVHIGRTLTLFCDIAVGKPAPKFRWLLNSTIDLMKTSAGGGDRAVHFGEGNKFIQIPNVTLADQGNYSCEAENTAGRDRIEFKVSVYQVPAILKVRAFLQLIRIILRRREISVLIVLKIFTAKR